MWDEWMGVRYAIRNRPINLPNDRPTHFTEEDEARLINIERKLLQLTQKVVANEGQEERRLRDIESFEQQKAELVQKRRSLTEWEYTEISRCIFGWETLTGEHYFWLRFCRIRRNIDGGGAEMISPDYRADEDWYWRNIRRCRQDATGLVGGKKRRYGNTWKFTALACYEMIFRNSSVFFVTANEDDGKKFFKDYFGQMWELLPPFLKSWKPAVADNATWKSFAASDTVSFVREYFFQELKIDEKEKFSLGLKRPGKEAPNCNLRTASAKNDEGLVGDGVSLVMIDEAGEMTRLPDVLNKIIPMLSSGSNRKRAGYLLALGTVGNMDGAGHVFKTVYKTPGHIYGLNKVLIPGWMGEGYDKCGNVNRQETEAEIRTRISELVEAKRMDLIVQERQKYPLTEEDMFLEDNAKKLMPMLYVEQARTIMDAENCNQNLRFGTFMRTERGKVEFVDQQAIPSNDKTNPEEIGYCQWVIAEEPMRNRLYKNMYVAGCDPIDMDKTSRSLSKVGYVLSDFAGVIYKRMCGIGEIKDNMVAWYVGRHENLDMCYEQMLLCQEWYSYTTDQVGLASELDHCKVNIEDQRGQRMWTYYRDRNALDYISYGVGAAIDGKRGDKWGFHNDASWWGWAYKDGQEWWPVNYTNVKCYKLVREAGLLGGNDNTDLSVAFFAARQLAREYNMRDTNLGGAKQITNSPVKKTVYYDVVGGKIVPTYGRRVNRKQYYQKPTQ